MFDKNMNKENINIGELTKQEKVLSLFKYIKELNEIKKKEVLRLSDYPWWRSISSFPEDDENIKIFYRDCVEDDENSNIILLSVHKPNLQRCPSPDVLFEEWLEQGWDNCQNEVRVKENNELFSEDKKRVKAYSTWINKRNIWAEQQKKLIQTREFFSELYKNLYRFRT